MIILAKRYGVSDVGLRKVCKKLQVPLPTCGHWARIRVGQLVPKPPLPRLSSMAAESTVIAPYARKAIALPAPDQPSAQALFKLPVHEFAAAVLREWRAAIKARPWEKDLIVRVDAANLDRAISLLSALAHALEVRGHTIETTNNSYSRLGALITGNEFHCH